MALGVWARVGSRFEPQRINGVSHFLEHMLFKGTKYRSTRKIKADVEGLGGVFNAFTGEESTCYFVKILRNYANKAFDVLTDMVNHSLLDPKEFEKERTVILEEIKMYLDLPSHHVQEILGELLWPDQALGRPIAGTVDTVGRLSAKELRDYMERYYHPKNLLVAFCGEVDHAEICELTDKLFSHKKSKEVSHWDSAASRQGKPRFYFINKKTEQMHFAIGFHGLPKMHPDRHKLAVLNVILGANMSSRLFEEVREKRGLAYEIRSGLSFFEDAGAVSISAGVEPKKARLAVHVIMRELKRLKTGRVSSGELRRAKDYFIGQFALGLEDTLDHMLWLGERMLFRNELPNQDEIRKNVEKVTSEDIHELAKKIFKTEAINFSLIGSYGDEFEGQIKNECSCS
ncbi:MAG: insulinase family protein [Candidatus Omnitrophica bacterium]|nr:insulinase family protein [Candidatus Omnitrophota bacterium]